MKAFFILLVCAWVALLTGCAATRIDAQWVDPQHAGAPVTGGKVVVDCRGPDVTVQRLCREHLAVHLSERGVQPLTLDEPAPVDPGQVVQGGPGLLATARDLGARAVLLVTVSPEILVVSPGPWVGVGVGGYGGGSRGYGGSGVNVGLGVGFPLGGGGANTGFGAKGDLSDVVSGRPIWSANASTPATDNVSEQVRLLTKALVDAAAQQGLF